MPTCGLTNTEIPDGELCLHVMLNPSSPPPDFYLLVGQVWRQAHRKSQEITAEEQAICDRRECGVGYLLPVKRVKLAQGTEYVGANLHTFHIWAVQRVLRCTIEDFMATPLSSVALLYQKMYYLRRNPIGLEWVGGQEDEEPELEAMLRLNESIVAYLQDRLTKLQAE